jgi:hypothetical protein
MLARPLLRTKSIPFSAGSGSLTYGTPADITNDSTSNAAPSGCVLSNGDWLAIYIKSVGNFESSKASVVGKISSDEGATWGMEFAVVSHATLSTFNPGICCLASGRVVLMYNLYDHVGHTTATDAVRTIYSDDAHLGASATWSSPYTVNASFTGYCAAGNSRPLVLPDQTVIIPVYGDSGGNTSSQAFFSTDDGETFGGAVTMANGPADGRNYYEPSIARLTNGLLLAQYRTTGGTGNMYQNFSADNGATWGPTAIAFGGFSPSNVIQRANRTIVAVVRGHLDGDGHAFTSINLGASWVDQGALQASFDWIYGLWFDRSDGTGFIIYSDQPAASQANADIRGMAVTEA